MDRRIFVLALGGLLGSAPLARAQQGQGQGQGQGNRPQQGQGNRN
ncbi:MAG: hypothetical protein ACKO1J_03655 [Tagaea sp.]